MRPGEIDEGGGEPDPISLVRIAAAVTPTDKDARRRPTASDRRLLAGYRALAFSTASLLLVIVFVGIPLQLAAGEPVVVNDVGTVHGVLYIGYLVVAFRLSRRLGVPTLRLVLILLAGTVPFAAFFAERRVSRRFARRFAGETLRAGPSVEATGLGQAATRWRRRWISPRALLLHLEVLAVAPACFLAGWWQATRALAGNGLSWVYSVEWPIFALLAVGGWWYLIHEPPEVYQARKHPAPAPDPVPARAPATASVGDPPPAAVAGVPAGAVVSSVDRPTARLASALAALLGGDAAVGMAALVMVPLGRPSGLVPKTARGIYLLHSSLGVLVSFGAAALFVRGLRGGRIARLSGVIGAVGVGLAASGGLLADLEPVRWLGMALMLLGVAVAAMGFLLPSFERLRT